MVAGGGRGVKVGAFGSRKTRNGAEDANAEARRARRGGRCGALLGGDSALSGGGELALLLGEERSVRGELALVQREQGVLGQAVQSNGLVAARHAFAFTVRRKNSQNVYHPI
jgi:hypothetical protein